MAARAAIPFRPARSAGRRACPGLPHPRRRPFGDSLATASLGRSAASNNSARLGTPCDVLGGRWNGWDRRYVGDRADLGYWIHVGDRADLGYRIDIGDRGQPRGPAGPPPLRAPARWTWRSPPRPRRPRRHRDPRARQVARWAAAGRAPSSLGTGRSSTGTGMISWPLRSTGHLRYGLWQAELEGGRVPGHYVGGSGEALGRLVLTVRRDDPRPPLPLGLGLPGHRGAPSLPAVRRP